MEAVQSLGQGTRVVYYVTLSLPLFECFERSEAMSPPLHSAGLLFGPLLLLSLPNPTFIYFPHKAQS